MTLAAPLAFAGGVAADVRAGAETLAIAVALGLADRRALHAADALWYRLDARYASDAHNRRGLLPWEATAIGLYFPIDGRIFVLGAGGGREALALVRSGYRVVAFECNGMLLDSARRLLHSLGAAVELYPAPRDEAPALHGEACDAAIIGWSTYMLVPGARARIGLLRGVRRWLRPQAPLLLSFFTRREADARLERIARTGSVLRRRLGRPGIELGDDLAPTFVHRFARAELAAELDAAGFAMARFEPQGPGPEDSGWAVAFARPDAATTGGDAAPSAAALEPVP